MREEGDTPLASQMAPTSLELCPLGSRVLLPVLEASVPQRMILILVPSWWRVPTRSYRESKKGTYN